MGPIAPCDADHNGFRSGWIPSLRNGECFAAAEPNEENPLNRPVALRHPRRSWATRLLGLGWLLTALVIVASMTPSAALPSATAAADGDLPAVTAVAAGGDHTCALLDNGEVRCWGNGSLGALGYGNTESIGDDEAPAEAGSVDLGGKATAIVAASNSTCALLDDGTVRCWGFGAVGQLGYGNKENIGDDETPAEAGPVDLDGPFRVAVALTAGANHVCALLDNGSVMCWGSGGFGRLGYGSFDNVGDDETPADVGPVNVGGTRVTTIAAGLFHTCALLSDTSVRCWGFGQEGALGYGNTKAIGDDETPATAGPVNVGGSGVVTALTAGGSQTCAFVPSLPGGVRCWGANDHGQLGTGNTVRIGDNETPAAAAPMTLGSTPSAISIGRFHACGVFEGRGLRCWGRGSSGQLGYANVSDVGAGGPVQDAGTVDLGGGATMVSSGFLHTCAVLDTGSVTCWGEGSKGRLGYGDTKTIGDDEHPTATVVVVGSVADQDAPPTAVDDSVTVAQDSAKAPIDVLANDTDPDGGQREVVSVSNPVNGSATIDTDGVGVSYRPDGGYCNAPGGAPDTFTYTVNGGSTATVEVVVSCTDAEPPPSDTTAPETTITTRANLFGVVVWASGTGKLTFVSDEAGSTFECRVDSGSFEPCVSGQAFSVPSGRHTIAVRARDAVGNVDATPAARTITSFKLALFRGGGAR